MVTRLTEREFEVLTELANGYDQCKLARKLHLSRSTVRTHVERIRFKLGANTMAHAVNIAYKERLFEVK